MANISLESLTRNPEIPSLPETVVKLQQLISSNASMEEITVVISHDPSLTVKTLEIANSAWYKRQSKVIRVADAIAVIGLNALQQLIFAASVARIFNGIETNLVDMKIFWKQSIRMALAAQVLSAQYDKGDPLEQFTRGIVAYIGKLALYMVEPTTSQRILTHSRSAVLAQHIAEKEILGFTHADISVALLKKWRLPKEFYLPIEYYCIPDAAPAEFQKSAAVLNLAHYTQYTYAREDVGLTDPMGEINQPAIELVGIEVSDIPKIAQTANTTVDDIALMLGISKKERAED